MPTVDIRTEGAASRESTLQGAVDARVMRRLVVIAGGALIFLAILHLGFYGRVMA